MARGAALHAPGGDDLFGEAVRAGLETERPLAARMRPRTLDEVVGQPALLGPAERCARPSPATASPRWSCTARLEAARRRSPEWSRTAPRPSSRSCRPSRRPSPTCARCSPGRGTACRRRRTVLFLDEIHRFNRAQQDALLPAVEDGLVTLIGATTQNPWYEVNAALVSRMRVFVLEPSDPRTSASSSTGPSPSPGPRRAGAPGARGARRARRARNGDARGALNLLEAAAAGTPDGGEVTVEAVRAASGAARSSTTARATPTTTRSRPSSRACAPATPTPPSTTWR